MTKKRRRRLAFLTWVKSKPWRDRFGRTIHARIKSYPVRTFDEKYRADEHDFTYEDGHGNPVSPRKFRRLVKKKMKRSR